MIIAWVLVGTILGAFLGGALADASASHPGDIGLLFVGLVIGAPLGALGAGLAAAALSLQYPTGSPARSRLHTATWIAPLLVVLGGWLFETARTWDDLMPGGRSAWVRYEVKLPPGTAAPAEAEVLAEFHTDKETRKQSFPGHDLEVERLAGQPVIRGSFETYKTARRRSIRLRIGDGPIYVFELKLLPSRPDRGYAKSYSDWHGAEQVQDGDKGHRSPRPDEELEIRYQMDLV
jgi:hypothetical protein